MAQGTVPFQLTSAWVDLGQGPLMLEVVSGSAASFAIADAQPGPGDSGFQIAYGDPRPLQTTRHIWGRSLSGSASIVVAPIVIDRAGGVGALTKVPAGTTNGAPLGAMPDNARGVRFYVPPGAAVTFTIQPAQPTSAPSSVFTVSQLAAGLGMSWDETLSGQAIYVTAIVGVPLFRWL